MIVAFDDSLAAMGISQYMVIFMLIPVLKLTAAATLSWSNTELAEGEQGDAGDARSRLRRHNTCSETEYRDKDICCLKCPAGTHVQSSCTTTGEKGICEDCDFDTYTEHENGLQRQCLKCTNCRSDQHVVRPCTPIQNTECQCKPGTFCAPDQACEICKKCSRCREGEVKVRNCTATANAVCKKPPSSPSTGSVAVIIISLLALLVAVVLVVALVCLWKRRRHQTATGSQSDINDSLKVVVDKMASAPSMEESQNRQNHAMTREDDRLCLLPQHCQRAVRAASTGKSSALEEDEDTGLGDSLANTASNSQSSLLSSQLPTPAPPCSTSYYLPICSPQPSSMVPRQLRDDDPIPSLIPLNGEESLKKCFEYFEDLDVDYHKRFFRHLGINDNLIKSKDHLTHEDRTHELLNVWMEKVGKDASLNHLLKALLTFNQRLTAENVIAKAIAGGYYERERE